MTSPPKKFPPEPHAWGTPLPGVEVPGIPFRPRHYICQRTKLPFTLDGRLDKRFWEQAPWSEDFVDIEGEHLPRPPKRTRFKMLWDDEYLYVGAELEEDQIWATLTERDSELYFENDFEIFLDPDGDTHHYYELEINALNTIWDLLLPRPYRDGGFRISAWDMRGLMTAVRIKGEVNNPHADNLGWSLEVAMPMGALRECAKSGQPPQVGCVWRMNFLRVNWPLEVVDGRYQKLVHPETGCPLPESNWSWSPMGIVNMHYPEMWGYVLFADGPAEFVLHPDEQLKWELRQVYYAQRNYRWKHGHFCPNFAELEGQFDWSITPRMDATANGFEASVPSHDGRCLIIIREDGRIWEEFISLQGR